MGVSEVYTKLRYLSYIMDVATPTADCLILVHDLLLLVITKGHSKSTLSHQEAAAKKRSRRHLVETDEFVTNNEATLMDPMIHSTSYQKMKSLCLNFRNEVSTGIEIHNHHALPRTMSGFR